MKPTQISPSNLVYQSSRLSVFQTKLTFSDKHSQLAEYAVIDPLVVVVPVDQDHQVYLQKRWLPAYKNSFLTLPSFSTTNTDARNLVNLVQKIVQNNLSQTSAKIIKLGIVLASPQIHQQIHLFLATNLSKSLSQKPHTPPQSFKTMPINQASSYCKNQQTTPAFVSLALLWAMQALELIKL